MSAPIVTFHNDIFVSACRWTTTIIVKTYQLRVEVPILLHRLRSAISVQIPHSTTSSDYASRSDNSYPDIEKARREIISIRTYGTPSFTATA
jgi:hypothetical protein